MWKDPALRVIGISPDASLLLGTRDRETICILDASSREVVAESDVFPEMHLLDETSVQWSPDGAYIAFGLMPWSLLRDSDVYVMDVSSGEVTNVTPEGNAEEAHSLTEMPEANVDMNPLWLDDDTLIFARHQMAENEDTQASLTKISLTDQTTEMWVDLSAASVQYVTSPIWQISDGSFVFRADNLDRSESMFNGVMIVNPDGTSHRLNLDDIGYVQLIDVNDTHIVVLAPETLEYWYIPLDSPADSEKLWDRFDLPGNVRMRSQVALEQNPDTLLLVVENENNQMHVLRMDDSGSTQVAELRPEEGSFDVHWAKDVILVSNKDTAWIVPSGD